MRYAKKLGLATSAIVLGLIFTAVSASAQVRVGVNFGRGFYDRPRYVQRVYIPAPVWSNGYYGNPYWRERSDRSYDRQSLRTAKIASTKTRTNTARTATSRQKNSENSIVTATN
jgi:hypothetical protein